MSAAVASPSMESLPLALAPSLVSPQKAAVEPRVASLTESSSSSEKKHRESKRKLRHRPEAEPEPGEDEEKDNGEAAVADNNDEETESDDDEEGEEKEKEPTTSSVKTTTAPSNKGIANISYAKLPERKELKMCSRIKHFVEPLAEEKKKMKPLEEKIKTRLTNMQPAHKGKTLRVEVDNVEYTLNPKKPKPLTVNAEYVKNFLIKFFIEERKQLRTREDIATLATSMFLKENRIDPKASKKEYKLDVKLVKKK
jgi:hypothetical protein